MIIVVVVVAIIIVTITMSAIVVFHPREARKWNARRGEGGRERPVRSAPATSSERHFVVLKWLPRWLAMISMERD